MEPRDKETPQPAETEPIEPPTAFIPACGTLCDAFWWARRGNPKKQAE